MYDWLLLWACQEFDLDVLRESLSEFVIDASEAKPSTSERQCELFAEDDAAEEPSVEAHDE